jgi:hypothetical protein
MAAYSVSDRPEPTHENLQQRLREPSEVLGEASPIPGERRQRVNEGELPRVTGSCRRSVPQVSVTTGMRTGCGVDMAGSLLLS